MNPTIKRRMEARYIKTPGGCWYWTGNIDRDGYGRIDCNSVRSLAHRVMMIINGHDVAGLDVDHVCRNRRCVNPAHLDAVTHAENVRRMRIEIDPQPKKRCKNNHPLTEENVYVHASGTRCRTCNTEAALRYKAKRATR